MRILLAARELGILTVTIFGELEKELPHALSGDESVCLGAGNLAETYLNQELLIKIAKDHGADAIHPGYGLLSENAGFCKKVNDAGIIFIGPSPESMALMGDKRESKEFAEKIKVPVIPGYHEKNQDSSFLKEKANHIGYPVLIKATAGGGGKGMKVVYKESEFIESLDSAKREAMNAFGNDLVILEKFIEGPRHIEVQVFGDTHGNVIHLYERECSIQRRHQKVIEECPSCVVTPKLREEITGAAVNLAKKINYVGAGTVEFIVDAHLNFYFLEMNTRLQVEHPVTEMSLGIDLVKEQIRVASGHPLSYSQNDIMAKGHAIEARIYAEDPYRDFLPSIGTIKVLGKSDLKNVRIDTGYLEKNKVTIYYDPMLAKVVALGKDREEAINKLYEALNDYIFLGLKTNRSYLQKILKHPKFVAGEINTNFIKNYEDDLLRKEECPDETLAVSIAAFLLNSKKNNNSGPSKEDESSGPWVQLNNFRNS